MNSTRMSREEAKVLEVMGRNSYQQLCNWAFETAYTQSKYYTPCKTQRQFSMLARKTRRDLFNQVYNSIRQGELTSNHKVLPPNPDIILEKLIESFGYDGVTRLHKILMQKEHARRGDNIRNS